MTSRTRIFVGHLDQDTRTKDLFKFFGDYGFSKIRDINLKAGFAFVDFEDDRDASDAVYELNHKDLLGSKITLEHAKMNRSEPFRRDRGGSGRDRDSGYRGGGRFREGGGRYGAPYNTEWRLIIENLSTKAGWQNIAIG